MKTVIIVGMLEAYDLERNGAHVWGVNRTYQHQKDLDRLYFMDNLDVFEPEFVDGVNSLGIPIICQRPYESIPNSEAYPIDEILSEFGCEYFTSTTAYMIAHAIFEGYEKIVLHQLLSFPHAHDYLDQKPCMDFWAGFAVGRGIQVVIGGNSGICQNFPWQAKRYGYQPGHPLLKQLINVGFTQKIDNTQSNERIYPDVISA